MRVRESRWFTQAVGMSRAAAGEAGAGGAGLAPVRPAFEEGDVRAGTPDRPVWLIRLTVR